MTDRAGSLRTVKGQKIWIWLFIDNSALPAFEVLGELIDRSVCYPDSNPPLALFQSSFE